MLRAAGALVVERVGGGGEVRRKARVEDGVTAVAAALHLLGAAVRAVPDVHVSSKVCEEVALQ